MPDRDETEEPLESLPAGMARGLFYGDVLTHVIPGAHWEVIDDRFPTVRISRKASISDIHVAQRRLVVGLPTLAMNYDHALDLTS